MLNRNIFDNYMEKTPDVEAYLKRIGIMTVPAPTLDSLNLLIRTHQRKVPFENVGICDHKYHVSLDINDLFDKIVVKKRGGYCFENNASFGSLLNGLGFNVRPCACRIMHTETKLHNVSHRANIVTIDGIEYFCDVGCGGVEAPEAIALIKDKKTICGKEIFYCTPFDDTWWEFHCISPYLNKDIPITEPYDDLSILINTAKVIPEDFYPISDYCCTSSESKFTQGRRVYIKTPTGFIRLMKNVLTIVDGDKSKQEYIPEGQIPFVLDLYFGLSY